MSDVKMGLHHICLNPVFLGDSIPWFEVSTQDIRRKASKYMSKSPS